MSIVVRSDTTLANDNIWNEWSDQLEGLFYDADADKNKHDDLLNALYNVKKSDRFAEKAGTFGTFGNFTSKTEGANAADDDFEQGYFNLLTHTTFGMTVTLSRELAEDSQFDIMAARAKSMVSSYKRSKAQFASDALVHGDATSFTYEGATYNTTGGDGKALFAADHPYKSVSGQDQSNLYTNVITDSNSLNRISNAMRNYKDDKGHVLGILADTIIVPGNAYYLEDLIKKIIGSDGEVGNDYNDINTNRGKWKLVVDHLWTPAIADQTKAPAIIMSSEANKELLGNTFYNRVELDVKGEVETKSRNAVYNGYARWSAGFFNWRHVCMIGSTNAAATTLA
jgi:phage major head subunit gpT-like protein